MRIDSDGVESYLLGSIWKDSLFSGILEQSDEVDLLRHMDIEPRLPSDREDLYDRATDMVRNEANRKLGGEFYPMLRELHGEPRRHVDPIETAHTVMLNVITFMKLKNAAPWGNRRVVFTRFVDPGLLWYVGDLGKFRHDVMVSEDSRPRTWKVSYLWGFEWADPLPLQGIYASS